MNAENFDTVVFDIGNVLIPWEPRTLLRKLLPDDQAVERFMREVDFLAWNGKLDAGQSFAQGVREQSLAFPHYAAIFQAYFERWEETIGAPIEGSVALLRRLRAAGFRVLALTNFSRETFPLARRRYPFLQEFSGILVSGEEKLIKPDPAIYRLLCERYSVLAARAVFIDDSVPNVESARQLGFHALHFTTPENLQKALFALGLLPEKASLSSRAPSDLA